jgi:flagellin-like protein
MKGVTPVITTILLLLIAIVVIGLAFGFFQDIFGTASTSAQQQLESGIDQTAQTIRIEAASGSDVTIRNTGSQNINTTKLAFFVDNAVDTAVTCNPTTVAPNSVSVCTLFSACSSGSVVKVTSPGNEDIENC